MARTDGEAADELMKALRRRESRVLDILVDCLRDQEEANADIIKRIRQGQATVERLGHEDMQCDWPYNNVLVVLD